VAITAVLHSYIWMPYSVQVKKRSVTSKPLYIFMDWCIGTGDNLLFIDYKIKNISMGTPPVMNVLSSTHNEWLFSK
jgi:uncharacterized metal-binding protein